MQFNETAAQNITAPKNTSTNYQTLLLLLGSLSVVGLLLYKLNKLRILSHSAVGKFFDKFKSAPGREDPAAFDPWEDMGKLYDLERQKRRPFY